jgi:DNA-binding HxlR family transcriptional regulator
MYKRKIEEDLDCSLYLEMKVFGAKWKPCIIDAIAKGAKRPSEIHKQLTSTSPRVLDMQLRDLLDFGVVTRKNHSGYPLYVEYSLTPLGESILPVLAQMSKWGDVHKEFVQQRNTLIQEGQRQEVLTPLYNTDSIAEGRDLAMPSVCQRME